VSRQFKLDENLPRDAAVLLNDAGFDVETVLEERLGGEPDSTVITVAIAEDRILVTLDADFADLRQHPPSDCPGIWVLRPHTQSIANILALLRGALIALETETASNRLWIVEPGRVRIHE